MIPLPTVDALDGISIPVPCPLAWDAMRGDDRSRFCGQCKQNVHDVSELTRAAAVELVTGGGRVPCLRVYRRLDGRVMTADCATKRERVWKWLHQCAPWAATAFALLFMAGCEPRCIAGGIKAYSPPPPSPDAVQSATGGTAAVQFEK